jgi:murein L,D-transpeptidase YcbB/YkuD
MTVTLMQAFILRSIRLFALLFAFTSLIACEAVQPVEKININVLKSGGSLPYEESIPLLSSYLSGVQSLPQSPTEIPHYELQSFYSSRGNQPVWYDQNGWKPEATTALKTLRDAGQDGLVWSYYLPASFSSSSWASNTPEALKAELQITMGMLRYIRDMRVGRVSGVGYDSASFLSASLSGGDLGTALAGLPNRGRYYQRLRQAMGGNFEKHGDKARASYMVTMEKLRQIPGRELNGRHIVVNVPGYELQAWDNGETQLAMPVVVGRGSRQTPVHLDQMINVKFSPDWTAPKSIIAQDYLPKLVSDPEFVSKLGVKIYDGSTEIDPKVINWSVVDENRYTFKMPPGPRNALGGVRFDLQNSGNVYLHDTPSVALFKEEDRARSSGCIRVGEPEALAGWVLEGQGRVWSVAEIKSAMTAGAIQHVPLQRKIPVDLVYYTAWVDAKGGLRLNADIYGYDQELASQLGVSLPTEPWKRQG